MAGKSAHSMHSRETTDRHDDENILAKARTEVNIETAFFALELASSEARLSSTLVDSAGFVFSMKIGRMITHDFLVKVFKISF